MAPASLWRGVALMTTGGLLFAGMGAMAKLASPSIATLELVAARSLVTLAVMELVRRRGAVPLVFYQHGILLSRCLAGFLGISAYFYALKFIPLGDAVLLNNASPVLTSTGAVLLLGEKMNKAKLFAMVGSMVGIWLLVHEKTGAVEVRGATVGAWSAVASAWALISLKIATRQNRSVMVVWSLAAVSLLVSLLFGAVAQDWQWPDGREALLMVATGVLAAMAQLLMTMGYRLMDASLAAIYSYCTPVFAVLLSMALLGQRPSLSLLLGGLCVIGSGAAVAWREQVRRAALLP